MTDPYRMPPATDAERARFRRTLAKVMTMQVVSLILLWLLQSCYTG